MTDSNQSRVSKEDLPNGGTLNPCSSGKARRQAVTYCYDGCGSPNITETNHYWICRSCGMTYSKTVPTPQSTLTTKPKAATSPAEGEKP